MNEHAKPQNYQQRVLDWTLETFGADVARDIQERCHRFLEEGLELVQSLGCTASEAHQLVDYVFGRVIGNPEQEIGGTMVCIAALAHAARIDLENAAEKELARCWDRKDHIREKWLKKPKHSPLPELTAKNDADDIVAVRDVVRPYLDMVNSTPELLSLLYDINMLPEQTVTIQGAIRLAGMCEVWKRMVDSERANTLMRPVIEAGDDLYASLAECDNNELSKFQRKSVETYAEVSNAYREPKLRAKATSEPVPYKVPHIVINEEAHGQ